MRRMNWALAGVIALAGLAGCATSEDGAYASRPGGWQPYGRYSDSSGPTRDARGPYADARTREGVVEHIERMRGERDTSGAGAVAGGVLGAVVGHQIGSGSGSGLATVVGAVGGAVIGNELERNQAGRDDRLHVTVRLRNGELRRFEVAQANGLRAGDRVRVQGSRIYRL